MKMHYIILIQINTIAIYTHIYSLLINTYSIYFYFITYYILNQKQKTQTKIVNLKKKNETNKKDSRGENRFV